jgi:ADP-ribose pyrophosphatase
VDPAEHVSHGPRTWTLLEETEHRGPAGFLRMLVRRFRMPDGRVSTWDILASGDVVAVVALTDNGTVVLARQFRAGPLTVLDELPGGFVDPGETPEWAAALLEETGFEGEVRVVGSTWLSGTSTVRRFAAVATGCRRVAEPSGDDEEFCEPVEMPLAEFRAHVRGGQLCDVDLAYLGLEALGLL